MSAATPIRSGESTQGSPIPVWNRAEQARPATVVWGESLWRWLERGWVRCHATARPWLSDTFHPLTQLGAIANITFLIAVVTGILLLFWYVPSVHDAYSSLERIKQSSWLAQLMRSLHRYSSDACMLFVLIHAVQIFLARKVGGPRWLAWITGILGMATLWFLGWTGYWLVWDDRAAQIAVGTSVMLDVLPIFADPLSRSFLVNGSVNSLLFFIIFFFHMLVPLVFMVLVWIHITRLKQSRFLTSSRMTIAVVVSLTALSLLFPAYSSKPAQMQDVPASFGLDWFYMLPIYLTERMQGGSLWALSLVVTLATLSLPWWMVRRKASPATIEESRCTACQKCFEDCPFNAIRMMPREGKFSLVAQVDPQKCVGCGVCVGSCDTYGVMFPALEPLHVRKQLDHWLEQADVAQRTTKIHEPSDIVEIKNGVSNQSSHSGDDEPAPNSEMVAFVCAESAAAQLKIDTATGYCEELPGYRVTAVPCAGWVHTLTVERAIRHGSSGVLIAGCGPDAACRLGDTWTTERLEGKREPSLRQEKVAGKPILHLSLERSRHREFLHAAKEFRKQHAQPSSAHNQRFGSFMFAVALILGLLAATWFFSDVPYRSAADARPMLVVSFKHPGQIAPTTAPKKVSSEKLLPHMRGIQQTERRRVPVRLRVWLNGSVVLQQAYRPKGVFEDGNSIAIAHIPVQAGTHLVRIEIGDSADPNSWNHQTSRHIEFKSSHRKVILFDKMGGFQWH